MSGTYSENARDYLDAGWTGVLPVPVETKFPPPVGYTGSQGVDTDLATVQNWIEFAEPRSIALRMPEGVIGIDVDDYDKTSADGTVVHKRGGATLAEYEALWGPLPATWRCSSRALPSGIRFYRVPAGLKFATVLGDAIEIIQRHHRYAVVAPSVHTGTGGTYVWSHPEYSLEIDEFPVPTVAELPELPAGWVTGLSNHVNQSHGTPASSTEALSLLGAITADPRPMCSRMEIACNRAVASLHAAAGGSRHDTAMARIMRIVMLAAEGCTGGNAALERAKGAWDVITSGEGREYEWDSLVSGAAAQAAGHIGASVPRALDPCEGGSGLGIEVVLDPGEGNRITTLIVEGLDDARMCAEYLGGETGVTVLGIAGRESWRKDGVPLPELRIVSGTKTVILLGPEVVRDLDVYTCALDLAEACGSKGSDFVRFTQPTGTIGVRVSAYLNSLDVAERPAALLHMIEVSGTPAGTKPARTKPPAARKRLGGNEGSDLPPTDDTFLGTTWADAVMNEFRVITTDKAWMSYRDGRWSVDGAELAVGYSVMEFLSDASQPIQAIAEQYRKTDQEEFEKYRRAVDAILSSRKRQAVQSTAMVYRPVHVLRDALDQHPTKWCAANGVLDLETGEVLPHDPELLLTTGSEVPFVPGAECPRFDRFLDEVLPDTDVRDFVMRVFAMAMYGKVMQQLLPVFIGEGRNGKGVLVKIMLELFGSHARTINAKALLKRKFDAHEQEIAQLAGKRLAVAEETGQGAAWDVARVNEWTGGGRLSGRFMQGNSFDFTPSHTLLMVTNHRPSVGQGEKAFWDRYKEVPFTVSFSGREDPNLADHIISHELPGVLNRLIEAGREYHAHGLPEPAAISVATMAAKVDADSLARFCAEHIAITHDHELDRIQNPELYDLVAKWWPQNVRDEVLPSNRAFPKLMRQALGFPGEMDNPRKLRSDNGIRLTWTGIRWLNDGDAEINEDPEPVLATPLPVPATTSATPNPMTVGVGGYSPERTIGHPNLGVADVGDRVADVVADVVDQETDVSAAPALPVADVADVADKSVMSAVVVERGTKSRSTEEIALSPALVATTDRAHRQHEQLNTTGRVPSGVVVLDLETDSADQQYDHPEPERFFRIGAYSTPGGPKLVHRPEIIIERLLSSRWVVGSNLVHFDLPVLGRIDPRVDVLALTREGRVLDTMITESVLNPIVGDLSGNAVGKAMKHFKLDAACERYGIPGKTHNLAAYVKKNHGGDYGAVEWDTDTELQDYVRGDITATTGLKNVLTDMLARAPYPLKAYVMREHRVHAIASQMGVSGFTADVELNTTRRDEAVARKTELSQRLIEHYEIPTLKADGKPAKSPAATKEGKDAIYRALLSLGVADADIPRTKATAAHPQGQPSFKGELMTELAARYLEHANVEAITTLCETVGDVNGVRTIYGTVMDHLKTDGKVHPHVATFQASGRWSVTKPGLTVFGKRGIGSNGQPRVNERAVFTASDPEHVLMAIDLSQVDARAIAVHSQDHGYLDLFEPGLDAHELVARMVWGDAAYDADPKNLRHNVKAITHGVPYGMGVPKLALNAKVSEATAQRVVDTMNAAFPRLQVWKQEVRDLAGVPGAYLDNGFGRLMRPDHERAYTQGPALMGQGCARDLMMQCLLNVDDLDPRVTRMLRAQIHDEAIFEFPKADAEELKRLVVGCFSFPWAPPGASRPVSMVPDTGPFGFRWSECY